MNKVTIVTGAPEFKGFRIRTNSAELVKEHRPLSKGFMEAVAVKSAQLEIVNEEQIEHAQTNTSTINIVNGEQELLREDKNTALKALENGHYVLVDSESIILKNAVMMSRLPELATQDISPRIQFWQVKGKEQKGEWVRYPG